MQYKLYTLIGAGESFVPKLQGARWFMAFTTISYYVVSLRVPLEKYMYNDSQAYCMTFVLIIIDFCSQY